MLTKDAARQLADALRMIEEEVREEVQAAVNHVHNSITPGKTTLDEIAFNKGRADGMAELWATLQGWAEPE